MRTVKSQQKQQRNHIRYQVEVEMWLRVEIIENKNVKPVSPTEEKEPTSDKREDKDKTLKETSRQLRHTRICHNFC